MLKVLKLLLLCVLGQSDLTTDNSREWTSVRGNSRHTGYIPISIDVTEISQKWILAESSFSIDWHNIVATNDVIFCVIYSVKDELQLLVALSVVDGSKLWTERLGTDSHVSSLILLSDMIWISLKDSKGWSLQGFQTKSGEQTFVEYLEIAKPVAEDEEIQCVITPMNTTLLVACGEYIFCYNNEASALWMRTGLCDRCGAYRVAGDADFVYILSEGPDGTPNILTVDRLSGDRMFEVRSEKICRSHCDNLVVDINMPDFRYSDTPDQRDFAWAWISTADGILWIDLREVISSFVQNNRVAILSPFDLGPDSVLESDSLSGGWISVGNQRTSSVHLCQDERDQMIGECQLGRDLEIRNELDTSLLWDWELLEGDQFTSVGTVLTKSHVVAPTPQETLVLNIETQEVEWRYPKGGQVIVTDHLLIISDLVTANVVVFDLDKPIHPTPPPTSSQLPHTLSPTIFEEELPAESSPTVPTFAPPAPVPWITARGDSLHRGYVPITVHNASALQSRGSINSGSFIVEWFHMVSANQRLYCVLSSRTANVLTAFTKYGDEQIWDVEYAAQQGRFSIYSIAYLNDVVWVSVKELANNWFLNGHDAATGDLVANIEILAGKDNPENLCGTLIPFEHFLVLACYDQILCYDALTNDLLWSYKNIECISCGPAEHETSTIMPYRLVVTDEHVFAVSVNPENIMLTAVDRLTGVKVYSVTEKNTLCKSWCDQLVADHSGFLWISSVDGIFKYDLNKRHLTNDRLVTSFWMTVGNDCTTYSIEHSQEQCSGNGCARRLYARDEAGGNILWDWILPSGQFLNWGVVVTDSHIFVPSFDKTYAVSIETQQIEWTYDSGGFLVLTEDTLYIKSVYGADISIIDLGEVTTSPQQLEPEVCIPRSSSNVSSNFPVWVLYSSIPIIFIIFFAFIYCCLRRRRSMNQTPPSSQERMLSMQLPKGYEKSNEPEHEQINIGPL